MRVRFLPTFVLSLAAVAAEGQATARLRVAEAEAQAIKIVADAIGAMGNPAQYLIAQRYLESLTQIAGNPQKIVFSAV